MNKVILIGNLTKDIELTKTENDISIAKFSIAVNRKYKNKDGEHDVDFFQITAWRELAELCAKFLKKGDKVGVSGELHISSYENKDGDKKYATEVVASDVDFLSPKKEIKDEE
jgi:single-strand DNA-binding protein